jgi:glycosyltransferase involved in cell wall biosynthesis
MAVDRPRGAGATTRDTVLFVSIAAGLGGSTRSLATVLSLLHPNLRRALATPATGKFPALVKERGLAEEHVPIPKPSGRRSRRLSRPLAAMRIARWARRHRGRLLAIHANGLQEVSLVVPAALVTRAPLVMWIHDFEVYPWTRRLGPLIRRLLRGRDVRWAAVSTTARDVVVESGLAGRDEVEIVTNPIDPADVVGSGAGRPGNAVGFIGSADRRKGFHLLPGVDEELSELPVRWEVFASPGQDQEATWARLRSLPESRISLHGKVEDIRPAYARCDVVFVPSLKESFCRVAAEAMLNGIPLVASDIGPLRELVGDEEAGLLFPPEDVRAAADALRRLLSDPTLRGALGDRGRERARAFEPERVVERLEGLYGGLTSTGSRGRA